MTATPISTPSVRVRLARFGILLLAITLSGTVGFMVLEGWNAVESLYMTVITLSTVGFSEVRPLSSAGRLFTTALIVAGVASVGYLFSAISHHIVSGELHGTLRRSLMQKSIHALSNHYIVCGFGRVGREVMESLKMGGRECVVVEDDAGALENSALRCVIGDAADDDILREANIANAAGLVAVTGSDATNVFITISARTLNGQITIVARANHPSTEAKLLRAGATHVLSPHKLGGRRIATQLMYPSVADFLDVVMHSGDLELQLEEITVQAGSDLYQKTVAEVQVRQRTGANVLAIRRKDGGSVITNPPSDMHFQPGDVLIALGTTEQLLALERLAAT
ncbi:MAG: potassium channel protein [Gemmatimonadota bacterium]|nr:MAG: potassium channel protein [Gemmatimonadota bacterium]